MQADASDPIESGTVRQSDRIAIALVDDDRNILTTVSLALRAEGVATPEGDPSSDPDLMGALSYDGSPRQ